MPGSFRIGKIAGIDIDINVSWIIILVLLTVSLATGWFPQLYPGWSTSCMNWPSRWLHADVGCPCKVSPCSSLAASPILSGSQRVRAWSSRWHLSDHSPVSS